MRKRASKKPEPVLELTKVYQEAASQIVKAKDRSKLIHKLGNIRASGDEIEKPFREFVDSGDVAVGNLIEPYTMIPDDLLPNLVCFPNYGPPLERGRPLKANWRQR
jgi:hypothetical protein